MTSLDQQQQPSAIDSRVHCGRLVMLVGFYLLVSIPMVLLLTATLIYQHRNPEPVLYATVGCALWMLYYVANLYCCDWYFFRHTHYSPFARKCWALVANNVIFRLWFLALLLGEPLYTLMLLVTPYYRLVDTDDVYVCQRMFCEVDAYVFAAFWWTLTHIVLVYSGTIAFIYLANTPLSLLSDHCEMVSIVNGVTMGSSSTREKLG